MTVEPPINNAGPDSMHAHLAHIQIMRGLSQTTLERIAKAAILRHVDAGENILVEGQVSEAVFFILDGEVRVYHLSEEGREQVLATLGAGFSFNTVAPLLEDEQHTASARAIRDTSLLVLRNHDFLALLRGCPDFAFAMLREFAGRLAHLTGLVENLALHSVRGRMARFLLSQADGEKITRRWTQDEIAEHLGTVRDMVGRTLREFNDAGYIRREGHRIILVDRAGLESESRA